jgi:hypothetical protein
MEHDVANEEAKPGTKVKGTPELDPAKEARAKEVLFADWSPEWVDLVKRACCPPNIPTDEFAMFVAQCKRTELDPLKSEADCVPRSVKVKKTKQGPGGGPLEYEERVTKWCFQPREIGLAARADRFADFDGIISQAVYANDSIEIDSSGLTVKHTFNPVGKRGDLIGAYAQVFRRGRRVPVVWLLFKDYAQAQSPLWGTTGATMIEKCARMAGWRRAYPNSFGDSYSSEEMASLAAASLAPHVALPETAGLHQTVDAGPAPDVAASRTAQVREQVARRAAAGRPPAEASAEDDEDPLPFEEPPPYEPEGPAVMEVGPDGVKGKPTSELTDEQILTTQATCAAWLKKNEGKAKGPNSARMERAALMLKLEAAVRTKARWHATEYKAEAAPEVAAAPTATEPPPATDDAPEPGADG